MSTMYFAATHTLQRGYFLGDVIGIIKSSWIMADSEPHEDYVLSLMRDDPLTFLWDRFIREHRAEVIWDAWEPGNRERQYSEFDARRVSKLVKGRRFDTYKELYPRLDGSDRQSIFNGGETGLGRSNIFEYYYFGQPRCDELPPPVKSLEFGRGVVDMPPHAPTEPLSAYIAPWEKCQGNQVYTHDFWREVVQKLLDAGVRVALNDNRGLMPPNFQHERLHVMFPEFRHLAAEMAQYTVTLSGNTGIGWMAGAGEYPLLVCEHPSMCFVEYGFEKCGFQSLKHTQVDPKPDELVARTLEVCREVHGAS